MLPTNVMSFMKKMVSNTETMNANQFINSSAAAAQAPGASTGGGAIGRLRQTLQQAQETVSNRLTQGRAGYLPQPDQQANEMTMGSNNTNQDSQQNLTQQTPTINCQEEKENQEGARPGDAGRCRVCVKAMKPDEYFKECTECGLKVCDDCASYSSTADGNEVSWRCSVCRRRGVAIIARRVQMGIEESEVLEGLGCETKIRKSPDARRLQNSGRADSETEVLLLAPKPSDVRRHSDVPLRDIAKFQATVSAATSQHDLGLCVSIGQERAKSSNDLDNTSGSSGGGPNISISVPVPTPGKPPPGGDKTSGKDKTPARSPSGKGVPMKRQRSYERGASEGALNLPANVRGRRASCDMRAVDASSILNNNTIPTRDKSAERASTMGIPGLNEKDLQRLQQQAQQHIQQQQQRDQKHPQQQPPQQHQQHQKQQQPPQQHPQHHQQQPRQQQPQHHPQQQQPQHPQQQQQPLQQPQRQQQPQHHPQQQQHYQQQSQPYHPQQQQQPYQQQPPQNQQYQQQQPQQQYQQQQYQPQQPQQQYHPQQQQQQPPPQHHPQQQQQQQYQQYQNQQQYQQHQQPPPQQQQYQQQSQQSQQQQQIMGRGKAPPSDLAIGNDMRRRSVQIYNTTAKQPPTPRSCASLDAEAIQEKKKQQLQQQQHVTGNDVVKRQGSSTDGEAIKIVIDDVDSTAKKTADNNLKGQPGTGPEGDFRTRVIRLRRDPQDRGYQTRGYGLRVVGGCSSPGGKPGNLRARVARVTPGSGADFAGIRRGDIVLSWNGVKLSNMTFEEVCKILDTSGDSVELNIATLDSDAMCIPTVPENEPTQDWESEVIPPEAESLAVSQAADQYTATSPSGRRLPRLPTEGRIQLRLFHDEVHNTLEISVANLAFGNEDCTTIDLNDIIITLRIGEKLANTRWNQCVLFTKVSPEDLFDSWLVLELSRGPDFLGEAHVDMGRVSLDDRPVWFPFSAKGSSSHRGSISQIVSPGGNTPPSARELARRLRMRMAGSQSQSEEQDDSSGQSSPCATSLLRPEVAWEMLGTLGPPSANLTSRSAPTSRRGSAQSDRGAIGMDGLGDDGRGSAPSTPALPRSLPPSRRGSFAFAVEQVINQGRRGSVAVQHRVPDMFIRQLPEIPDGSGIDPAMLRQRRGSSWNPREMSYDRRNQFERTDSLRAMTNAHAQRRTSEVPNPTQSFRDVVFEARARLAMQPKRPDPEDWRQQQWAPQ